MRYKRVDFLKSFINEVVYLFFSPKRAKKSRKVNFFIFSRNYVISQKVFGEKDFLIFCGKKDGKPYVHNLKK